MKSDASARDAALGHLMEAIAFAIDEHRDNGWDQPRMDWIQDLAADLLDAGHVQP